ncbi:MAG: nucleotide exchange factor GrpE [Ruminococcaceae bacterium]|nr:nucleotide exchange factor GrpE [Oscillospiraceae bacterium]
MASKKKNENTSPAEEKLKQDTAADTAEDTAPEAPPAEPAAPEAPAQNDSDKYLRLMAEFDNYKKRSIKERENIYTDVRVDTVTKFLPVYDNLERAMKAETADEAYKKGVEMTFNQLLDVFKKLGVEEIEALDKSFDPNFHNAVMHVEDETLGEGVIVEEFQKGFKIGEKVIRFSMVKVAN